MNDATRFPLCWPPGRPRTDRRSTSRFKVQSFARVRDELLNELKLMRVQRVILSTNMKLRLDGLPLAGQSQPSDPGVAIYFAHKGKDVCFACDRWTKIEDNLQAVRHTIEALRGIARWGTGDMVDAAFSGFAQLPMHAPPPHWSITFGLTAHASTEQVTERYRLMARDHHPDRNDGNDMLAKKINAAWEAFKRERGL